MVSIPFLLFGLGSIDLLDPDEGLYGSIALEMAKSGDWITPHFNGIRYLEKPPLYFWLTAGTAFLFGSSEWVIRLWSAVPTLGTAILTWRLGGLLYGGHAGVLSAIVLVTNVGVFRYARVAATDCLLVFSLALSLYGFVRMMLDRHADAGCISFGSFCFYLGMALGLLSKGLIGVALPLLVAGLYLWLSGDRIGIRQICLKWGVPFFLALILPWHLLAAWKNPGFFEFYVIDNQFFRFLSSRAFLEDDIPVGTAAFIGLTWLWFFPWSLFLLGTLRHGFSDTRSGSTPDDRLRLLVGLWAVVVLGFFSLSSSTLEHYMLPALPPLSLMVGALWAESVRAAEPLPSLKWLLVAGAVGCGLVGGALILSADRLGPEAFRAWMAELNVYYRILREQGAPFPFSSVAPFVELAKELGAVLAIGVPVSLVLFLLRRPLASYAAMIAVAAGIGFLVLRLLLVIEPHHSAKSVALALNRLAHRSEPIIHQGSLEYSGSLPFYTGRQIHVLNGRRGDLEFGSRYPEGQGLFLDDAELARLWREPKRVFLVTREPGQGDVLAGLSGQTVFHLGRHGSRSLY
ncbi:MAG: glycosyltransferase family 39 protein, partial [Deltaproteobacteria bacterium]|nr:glycosyltransferase family 39 protein [Deltaproteobacteria bacterium]